MHELFLKYDGFLKSILEVDHGFRVVIPKRDFMPGTVLLNTIADTIIKSRRMIILLTK